MCQGNTDCGCNHDIAVVTESRAHPRGTLALGYEEASPLSQYVSQFSESPVAPEQATAAFVLLGFFAVGVAALVIGTSRQPRS